VWSILHVQDLVNGKCTGLAEALSAIGALERLLFGMDVSVVSQMILSAEGLATDITVEGALVGVGPLVDE
jgi:hypothetical protein